MYKQSPVKEIKEKISPQLHGGVNQFKLEKLNKERKLENLILNK